MKRNWAVGVLLGVVVGPAIAAGLGWSWRDRKAANEVGRIRSAAGIPESRASLYRADEVDPKNNGAAILANNRPPNRSLRNLFSPIPTVSAGETADWKNLLTKNRDLISDTEGAAAKPSLAMPPGSPYFDKSGLLMMRLFEGSTLLTIRAQVATIEGRPDDALHDLGVLKNVANRLNRIPTVSAARLREASVDTFLQTAAACAVPMAEDPPRLAQLRSLVDQVEPAEEERDLLGEASKELEAATRRDIPNVVNWNQPQSNWVPMQMRSVATRFEWGPELAHAWRKTIEAYRANPDDLESFGKPLSEFEGKYHSTVEILTFGGSPGLAPAWRKSVRRNKIRIQLLGLGLDALEAHRIPNATGTTDLFGRAPYQVKGTPSRWVIYSVGADGIDDKGFASSTARVSIDLVLRFNGDDLTFAGS